MTGNKFFLRIFSFSLSAIFHALLLFFVLASFPALGVQEEKVEIKEKNKILVALVSLAPKNEPTPQKLLAPDTNTNSYHQVPKTKPKPKNIPEAKIEKNIIPEIPAPAEIKKIEQRTETIQDSVASLENIKTVSRVKPIYPQIARKRGEEGTVTLLVRVQNGRVVNVSVERSSGVKTLDMSAASAVEKWQFPPDTNTTVRIPVSFSLKE